MLQVVVENSEAPFSNVTSERELSLHCGLHSVRLTEMADPMSAKVVLPKDSLQGREALPHG